MPPADRSKPFRLRASRLLYEAIFTGSLAGAALMYAWCTHFYSTGQSDWISYQMLGQAFLAGHTHLGTVPDPRLLALPNPYNPAGRDGIRLLWDASLYQGKYYLYFGPVPALLLWIPVKLATGFDLHDLQLNFIFCLAGTYFLLRILAGLMERQPPGVRWEMTPAIFALGFGTWIFQMLHQGGIYDVPVAGAY
ncbi:MAG: hypothetical protein KGJ06_10330, partial [Pseudomonadota bacterium]|nr:hypothetical protein [Pseudomonadota bacterium]